jgi:hypothetical protein
MKNIFSSILIAVSSSSALAIDQDAIDKLVNVTNEFCHSGKNFKLSIDIGGNVSLKKLGPGADIKFDLTKENSAGAIGVQEDRYIVIENKEIRDCMRPTLDAIRNELLKSPLPDSVPVVWKREFPLESFPNSVPCPCLVSEGSLTTDLPALNSAGYRTHNACKGDVWLFAIKDFDEVEVGERDQRVDFERYKSQKNRYWAEVVLKPGQYAYFSMAKSWGGEVYALNCDS